MLLAFFLLSALWLPAPQESAQKNEDEGFKIGVAVDQVFLSVNARSLEGGFVKGLSQDDFRIYEEGVRQEIVNFYSEAVPVSVVLLIDISISTRESQGAIRRAALQFARSLDEKDRVAIITFNDKPRLILNWTDDPAKVKSALERIYAKGKTVLHDALYVTFEDLLKEVEGKSAVILLTDGVDTASMVSFKEVLELAARSETMVYVVSTLEEYWASAIALRLELRARAQMIPHALSDKFIVKAKRMLERLAYQTGGKVLDTKAFTSLTDVYAKMAEEIKNQYYVSYLPVNIIEDGKWRSIEVRIIQPGVVVSTRPGYYAPLAADYNRYD